MTTSKGHKKKVYVGANAVGELQDYSVRLTGQKVEDSCLDDDWQTFKQTIRGFAGSLRCWFDESDTAQDALRAAIITGGASAEVASMKFENHGDSGTPGYIGGTILLDDIEIRNPGIPGIVEMVCNFTGTGTPTDNASS